MDLCYVVTGAFDWDIEAGLKEWDLAAGRLVASEAGAWVSTTASGIIVRAGPTLHPFLESVGGARRD